MEGNYSVKIESFAERHFIKSFQKKYKTAWDVTQRAIIAEFEHIDALLLTDRAETKFTVAGTHESAKASGNRCIIAAYKSSQSVLVLLIYGKTDLGGRKETDAWKNLVRDNYPDLKGLVR